MKERDPSTERIDPWEAIEKVGEKMDKFGLGTDDLTHIINHAAVSLESTRREKVAELRADPLINEHLKWTTADGRPARIKAPWRALAEQKVMAMILLAKEDVPKIEILGGAGKYPQEALRSMIGFQMLAAKTYLWSEKITDTAFSYPLPEHIIRKELLAFPVMYHCYEVAYGVKLQTAEGPIYTEKDYTADGFLILPVRNGFCVASMISDDRRGAGVELTISMVKFGAKFPQDFSESEASSLGQILSLFAFLESPYTGIEKVRAPRAFRRHGGVSKKDNERDVNVVILRTVAKKAVADYEAASKERKIRWWVRGHYRAQWYPSKKSHKVIWIAPHLKGPQTAPIKDKIYAVTT